MQEQKTTERTLEAEYPEIRNVWEQLRRDGYTDEEILEALDSL